MPQATFGLLAYATLALAPAAAAAQGDAGANRLGVLVMAHGGTGEWDEAVANVAASLARDWPTTVAFGMADSESLTRGLDALRVAGVDRVAVVRLFLSGASFRDETKYLLGLSDLAPTAFRAHGGGHAAGATPPPEQIRHGLEVATHEDGIVDSDEAGRILADRVRSISRDGPSETLLLLAHGMGDPADDEQLLAAMAAIEVHVRERGFTWVHRATLREDWPEARAIAEREIRDYVRAQNTAGRRVLVVPVRVSGFGPYADVLEGLDYVGAEALLPHAAVSDWLRRKVDEIATARGWVTP
jgi:hypothetical protein